MTRRSSSSSSSDSKKICHNDGLASEPIIALINDLRGMDSDTSMVRRSIDYAAAKPAGASKDMSVKNARIHQFEEDEYTAQMVELRLEVQKARRVEQRLYTDHDKGRIMMENLQFKERR